MMTVIRAYRYINTFTDHRAPSSALITLYRLMMSICRVAVISDLANKPNPEPKPEPPPHPIDPGTSCVQSESSNWLLTVLQATVDEISCTEGYMQHLNGQGKLALPISVPIPC